MATENTAENIGININLGVQFFIAIQGNMNDHNEFNAECVKFDTNIDRQV